MKTSFWVHYFVFSFSIFNDGSSKPMETSSILALNTSLIVMNNVIVMNETLNGTINIQNMLKLCRNMLNWRGLEISSSKTELKSQFKYLNPDLNLSSWITNSKVFCLVNNTELITHFSEKFPSYQLGKIYMITIFRVKKRKFPQKKFLSQIFHRKVMYGEEF